MSRVVHKFEATVKEVDVRLSVAGGDAGRGPPTQKTEVTVYTLRNGVVRARAHSALSRGRSAERQSGPVSWAIPVTSCAFQHVINVLHALAIPAGALPACTGCVSLSQIAVCPCTSPTFSLACRIAFSPVHGWKSRR